MTTLEARIAEVLAEHHIVYWGRCKCGTVVAVDSSRETGDQLREHLASVTAAMLAPVIREAKVEALREAVSDFESFIGVGEFAELSKRGPLPWGHIEEAWESQGPYMDWLRNRADSLDAS
ncbi:hypothetical protein BLJ79_21460 [Arthrobacter sp. UCD-GKA]|uniref:flagellar biosynthesis anti-sigma factor FlgM n=1 Tax=Arthrobacter sp. UCD-GKA TaxID=1913576 RepID=UPI0008DD47D7|nr:flagellar biosynthesis anti-sigma factor FlgM [Arthrobacter sp. UCD-GKA]OIH81931.1 hypothetical protein BLJ79_21460 [Arthrobacter sp. UCD-GKA]